MNIVYEEITDRIIQELEKGTIPWKKPWKVISPKNYITKKSYKGINIILLGLSGYSCPYWATFNQINKANGSIKGGEKSTSIVYWNWIDSNEENQKNRRIPVLRHYKVFNLEQTTIKIPIEEITIIEPIKVCDNLISNMPNPPSINYDGGERAFYRPKTDSVHLPPKQMFTSTEEYYGTLFHELVHSTGHVSRLIRPGIQDVNFGSEKYSKEELVAEIGAAFLCGQSGIETTILSNSASYISSWLNVLKEDKRIVVLAAGQAQKAVDYITNTKEEK